MFVPSITKDQLRELPLFQFKGQTHVIDSAISLRAHIHKLTNQEVLGFDTETKPSFKKGKVHQVALLQLATTDEAFIFRLHPLGLQDELIHLLTNPHILKVGAAIRDDIKLLQKVRPFHANGFLELQDYVKKFGIENSGLSSLAGIIMNSRISKSQQLSNWESETLTEAQMLYAATDAWACREIYLKLKGLLNGAESFVVAKTEEESRE
jgi:ribonuclease D